MKKRRIIIEVAIFLLLSILCLIAMTARKNREKVYTTEGNTLIINEGVEEIEYYDLIGVNKKRIKNIQFPASLKRIGSQAFEGYEELTSIQLPDSLNKIESEAFKYCWRLDSINIPSSVTSIRENAFHGTSIHQFTTYDNGQKYIWLGDWDSTPAVVTIPEGVTTLESEAFRDNPMIQSVTLPSTIKKIGELTFLNCSSLKEIIGLDAVDTIERRAFNDCDNLNQLLCYNHGKNCLGWPGAEPPQELTIPDGVETIDNGAFSHKRQIQKVTLPQSLKKIGEEAFYGCLKVNKIELPQGLEYIDENAFKRYSDAVIEIVNLPSSLTYIERGALDRQPYNKVVTYANGTRCYGWVGDQDSCPHSITLPQGVKSIDRFAFNNCRNLERIVLPQNLDTISEGAFENCRKLRTIENLSSVHYISPKAFKEYYDDNYSQDFKGLLIYDNGQRCFGWMGKDCPDTLIIPTGVKVIDGKAFYHQSLKSIILPDGLETIEERAFESCYDLSSITMPPSVRQIKEEAFAYCSKLKLNQLPDSLKEIGILAFRGCDEITQVHIPQGVQKVENSAFKECHGITSVTIPQGVKVIEKEAFNGCSKLQNLVIGDDITEIGSEAFLNCDSLVFVKLPDSLTTIREYTFAGCNHLKEIHLPAALKEIEAMAFEGCPQLRMPKMGDNVQMHRDAFGKSFQTALLDFIRDCGWSIFWLLALLAAGLFIHKEYGWGNLLSKLETTSFTKILKVIGIIVAVIFVIILLGLFIIFLN